MSDVTSVIGSVVALFSLTFVIVRIKETVFKYHTYNFELYEKLRELCGRDANQNYSALLVALNALIKQPLSTVQIEWFIYCPNAYLLMKRFDVTRRYIAINIEAGQFAWQGRLAQNYRRYILSILLFCGYVFFGTISVMGFQIFELVFTKYQWIGIILLGALSVLSLLFSYILLREFNRLNDAKILVDKGEIATCI